MILVVVYIIDAKRLPYKVSCRVAIIQVYPLHLNGAIYSIIRMLKFEVMNFVWTIKCTYFTQLFLVQRCRVICKNGELFWWTNANIFKKIYVFQYGPILFSKWCFWFCVNVKWSHIYFTIFLCQRNIVYEGKAQYYWLLLTWRKKTNEMKIRSVILAASNCD